MAVLFHIYYEDAVDEIVAALSNTTLKFDLYVTHSSPLAQKTIDALEALPAVAHFLKIENKGMDIYPFLKALEHFQLFNGRIVCKLHTKRGDGEIGNVWKDQLLTAALGDGARFSENVTFLRDNPSVHLLGADSVYLSAHQAMKQNASDVELINSTWLKTDIETDWGFFAGTMFWARSEIFKPLPKASEIAEKFERGATRGDGEFAHALERVFGLLPRLARGTVATLVLSPRGAIQKLDPKPSRRAISQIMRDIKSTQVSLERVDIDT
nr:rhamnan synthesis F family protein [Aquamicrobium sp. LC103]